MHARKMLGSSTAATISSRRAFVLPQLVGIASGSEGLVTRLFVKERDEIRRGQDLLEIEWRRPQVDGGVAAAAQEASPSEPGRTDGALADASQRLRLKASVTGVVSRCHVKVGDVVRRRSPVVSMLRADDVLVIARFDAAAGPRLRRDRTAWVHLPRAGAYCMPARIIRVGGTEPSQADPWAPREAGAVLVVAQLSSVTFDALSPGVEATVEVSGFDEAA